jgi:hypothetical protein
MCVREKKVAAKGHYQTLLKNSSAASRKPSATEYFGQPPPKKYCG